jgi:hypothetical protein
MEKTSKVTNVAGIGTWNGQYGVMYKFEVSFENGDSGQYMSKITRANQIQSRRISRLHDRGERV